MYINVWNRHPIPIPTPILVTTIPTPIPITTIPTPIPTPPKRTTNDSDSDSDSDSGIGVGIAPGLVLTNITQANCTWRIWEYCSKASLKDSQQSNVVPTLKRCSSISSNCTDHLRHNYKMYPKKHIQLRQFVPPQRKPQRIPPEGGLLPMRKRVLTQWSLVNSFHWACCAVIG